jgi:hypothetical protein
MKQPLSSGNFQHGHPRNPVEPGMGFGAATIGHPGRNGISRIYRKSQLDFLAFFDRNKTLRH